MLWRLLSLIILIHAHPTCWYSPNLITWDYIGIKFYEVIKIISLWELKCYQLMFTPQIVTYQLVHLTMHGKENSWVGRFISMSWGMPNCLYMTLEHMHIHMYLRELILYIYNASFWLEMWWIKLCLVAA